MEPSLRANDGGVETLSPTTKKPQSFSTLRLVVLVRLAGIEPTTPWFVAKYSIQLSYSRRSHDYRHAFGTFFSNSTNSLNSL